MSAAGVLCKPGGATPGDSLSCVCCLCHCSVLRERRAGTSLSQHPEPLGEGAVARVWAVSGGRWAVAAAGPQRKHRPFPSVNAHIYVLAKMEVAVTKPFSSPVILSRRGEESPAQARSKVPSVGRLPRPPVVAREGAGPSKPPKAWPCFPPRGSGAARSLAGGSGEGSTPRLAA